MSPGTWHPWHLLWSFVAVEQEFMLFMLSHCENVVDHPVALAFPCLQVHASEPSIEDFPIITHHKASWQSGLFAKQVTTCLLLRSWFWTSYTPSHSWKNQLIVIVSGCVEVSWAMSSTGWGRHQPCFHVMGTLLACIPAMIWPLSLMKRVACKPTRMMNIADSPCLVYITCSCIRFIGIPLLLACTPRSYPY